MATPKQVQLRGGTSEEHNSFVGASREITIDTTNNTIRVHDGKTFGGYAICRVSDLITVNNDLNQRIDDMQNNLGGSHNHDDRYALKNHNHDDRYYKRFEGGFNVTSKVVNGYHGFCSDDGNDSGWYRTSTSGLLPYKSGGYSSIGASSWKFNEGWFNTLNCATIKTSKGIELPGGDSRNQIKFGNDDYISYNDGTNEFDFLGDNNISNSKVRVGRIETQGRRIYIQSSRPTDARTGDIWFQI